MLLVVVGWHRAKFDGVSRLKLAQIRHEKETEVTEYSDAEHATFTAEAERVRREVNPNIPGLSALMRVIESTSHLRPTAVVLPSYLNAPTYRGPGSTDLDAMLMGMPVVWGTAYGLVYEP